MKQLVIFPVGQLCPKDKDRLSKEGFVAVEAQDPSKVVLAMPYTSIIIADDIIMSAFKAINQGGSFCQGIFVSELFTRMQTNEQSK